MHLIIFMCKEEIHRGKKLKEDNDVHLLRCITLEALAIAPDEVLLTSRDRRHVYAPQHGASELMVVVSLKQINIIGEKKGFDSASVQRANEPLKSE